MKTTFTLSLLLFLVSASANEISTFQKLNELNRCWSEQKDFDRACLPPSLTIGERKWIQYHLTLVEKTLRARGTNHLTPSQAANRFQALDALHQYLLAENFPVNDLYNYRTPIFIDRYNNFCAVGYLIKATGHENISRMISQRTNLAYVRQMNYPELNNWASDYGFTTDELAWIQPTYPPYTVFSSVGAGTNGPVSVMEVDGNGRYRIVFAGTFDTLDNSPCLNLGTYSNKTLSCLGGGIAGIVRSIYPLQYNTINVLLVAGDLLYNGSHYPLAIYNDTSWKYVDIPSTPDAIGTAVYYGGYDGYQWELAIISAANGYSEIWMGNISDVLEKKATVSGMVNCITYGPGGRVYAGTFDSIQIKRTGMSDTIIEVNNAVIRGAYSNWYGLGSEISDTVLVARMIGSTLYLGGKNSSEPDSSRVCLTRYLNGTLQPLLMSNWLGKGAIYAIDLYGDNSHELLIAGEFGQSMGTYGRNLASYDLINGYHRMLGDFDDRVSVFANLADEWILGGSFTSNLGSQKLSRLARIGTLTDVSDLLSDLSLSIYPNPCAPNSQLNIAAENGLKELSLFDLSGRIVLEKKCDAPRAQIHTGSLTSGMYMLHITGRDDSQTIRKIVVE